MTKKKSTKRKSSYKKKTSTTKKSKVSGNLEGKLVENFVSLQKVMVNLSVKFDNLANQISKLLELFEISAKALAKKDIHLGNNKEELQDIKNQLNEIFGQNKVIAKGIALLHDQEPVKSEELSKPVPSLPGLTQQKNTLSQTPSFSQEPQTQKLVEKKIMPEKSSIPSQEPISSSISSEVTTNPSAFLPPSQEQNKQLDLDSQGEEFHKSIYNPHEQPKQFKKLPKV